WSKPSSRCRGRAGEIRKPLPKPCAAPSARRSARPGTRSPHATCTCSRCRRAEKGRIFVLRTALSLAAALVACASGAPAQEFPSRFVTIVAPFQAGGPSDTVARLIAGPMSKFLGQQVVVENTTGAGGTIGSGRVAKAAPDGYTLGISGSGTHAAVEQLYANPPYKALDFDSIGLINQTPVILVGKKALPPNTLQEFIAYLRTNEKTVTEGDAGVGSVSHLGCSVFKSLINVKP